MPIDAAVPTVTPPTLAVTYNKWWLRQLVICGAGPLSPFTARVTMVKASASSSLESERLEFSLSDLYAEAASDPELVKALATIVVAIGKRVALQEKKLKAGTA